jgi:hypothetical protein
MKKFRICECGSQKKSAFDSPLSLQYIVLHENNDADVNVIVAGDKEMQMVGTVAGVKIISPRQFWQELTKEAE